MVKLNGKQRKAMAAKIREYKNTHYPGRGSGNRLAAALGVSPQLVSYWINGAREPSPIQLYAMARLFGISMQKLCGIRDIKRLKAKTAAFEIIKHLTDAQISIRDKNRNCKISDKHLKSIKHIIYNQL